MEQYKAGDKSKAICSFCKEIKPTTLVYRDMPLSSGDGMVCDLLVAVCDTCGHVVGIINQIRPQDKLSLTAADILNLPATVRIKKVE